MPNAINALDHSAGAFGSWDRNALTTLGEWRIKNQTANIVPSCQEWVSWKPRDAADCQPQASADQILDPEGRYCDAE
jgi:hypothetical protein